MIPTKAQLQIFANKYDLGKLKSSKKLGGGWVNYNYLVKTEKGEYIFRILAKYNDWKRAQIEKKFRVLKFLKKERFEINTPYPIKNKIGENVSQFGNKYGWVYEIIPGKRQKIRTIKGIKEIAGALAKYHKCIIKLSKKEKSNFYEYEWLHNKYKQIGKVKPKNNLDKLMLKHYQDFYKSYEKIMKFRYHKNQLYNHHDFHQGNVLSDESGNITGIIDFELVEFGPRIADIAATVKNTCHTNGKFDNKKFNEFIKTYNAIQKLSKEEINYIFIMIIRKLCLSFWWTYEEMDKVKSYKYTYLKNVIHNFNNIIDQINKRPKVKKIWEKL